MGYNHKATTQLVSHIFCNMSVYLTEALVKALGLLFIKEIRGGVTIYTVYEQPIQHKQFYKFLYFNTDFKLFIQDLTFYICILFLSLCNTSFKEHLPEDGHNRWPKHVAGYAVYNTINLHICICTCWFDIS